MIKPRLLRNVAAVSAVLALSLVLLALSARDGSAHHQVPRFNPSGTFSLTGGAANTPAGFIGHLEISEEDVLFGANVAFIPPDWGVASAGDLAIGTQVGTLDTIAVLGLLNGPCATLVPVFFDLLNGSVNTADTISGLPAGVSNRLQPMADDVSPANGVPDGADRYPDYLNDIFTGLTPRARTVGITIIGSAGKLPVVLNFMVFEVGTQIPESDLIKDPPFLDPLLGFPSVTVLQDPTEPAAPSAVTDFCTPLIADTVGFDNIRTNPGPGTYTFVSFSRSQRDADDDGFENFLDTCPFDPNNENPKIPGNADDPDVDGIDSACDNLQTTTDGDPIPWNNQSLCRAGSGDDFLGGDCDGDGFLNRGDNCPQHANVDQADNDNDSIGNVCDLYPDAGDGLFAEICLARSVDIGPGKDGTSVEVAPPVLDPCGNDPPVAGGDAFTVAKNSSDNRLDVLANDSDSDGPVTVWYPSVPDFKTAGPTDSGGTAEIGGTDRSFVSYSPEAGFTGEEKFPYTIADGTFTATATVTVSVINSPPVCQNVSVSTFENTASPSFSIDCQDADGDELECTNTQPANGTATVKKDCSSGTYTPDDGFSGSDSFTFKANDGTDDSPAATVSVTVVPLLVGMNLIATEREVTENGSTVLQAVCAEVQNGIKPITGVDITFKIDSQPGSDADLDGKAEVTVTSDATTGVAETTLNVGATISPPDIVVSATADCGTATTPVTVKKATPVGDGDTAVAGEGTGPTGGAAGGADTGVGSLAPAVASIPAWAAIVSALGGAGLLGSLGAMAARIMRRRRQ